MKKYRTYMFRDQDPAVAEVLDAVDGMKMTDIEQTTRASGGNSRGISPSTIRNWRTKKTKRPQHATLAAVAGAGGKKFKLVDA